jgi:hypothetical protein
MKTLFLETRALYDGSQLRSLFAYMTAGLLGPSIVSWRGPCDVSFAHMVDGEDRRANAEIAGSDMLHFIVEIFGVQLETAVVYQRLLATKAADLLGEKLIDQELAEQWSIRREGDDLFLGEGKLSISIATASPTSALIHFALNCSNEGTPADVVTAALDEIGVEPEGFARELMRRFASERESILEATMKVRSVD